MNSCHVRKLLLGQITFFPKCLDLSSKRYEYSLFFHYVRA